MSDFPLPGLTDFLKSVVPFNTLNPMVLQTVIQTAQVAFYPAGEPIIRMGEPAGEFLYVVQTGCARVAIRDESGQSILVDFRGEGDSFGAVSLLKGGSAMFDVCAEEDLISELNDRVVRQFLHIIEGEMKAESWGPPPVAYSWLALGSQGRREQTLCTDQDNALVYADVPPDQEPPVKAWFLEFARRVVDAMERYGIPKCQAGILASNPLWCMRFSEWRSLFRDWVETPTPEDLRLATIFFDFRGVSEDALFTRRLRKELTRLAAGKKSSVPNCWPPSTTPTITSTGSASIITCKPAPPATN